MVSADAYLKALAALVVVCFGAIAFVGRARHRSHVWLAIFFGLIAGNQLAETARAVATTDAARVVAFRAASVFASLDPAALFMFASLFPTPNRLHAKRALAPVAVVSFALALYAGFGGIAPLGGGYELALSTFTLVVYGIILVWSILQLMTQPEQPEWAAVVPAMMIVAFPVGTFVIDVAFRIEARGGLDPIPYPLIIAIDVVLIAVAMHLIVRATRQAPAARAVVRRGMWATLAILTFIHSYRLDNVLNRYGLSPDLTVLVPAGQVGAPLRWLAFGGLLSVALLRHEGLGMSLRGRRRAARVLIGLTFLSATTAVLVFLQRIPEFAAFGFQPFAVVLIIATVAASQSFRGVVDRVAFRVYGVPMPGDVAGRHEAYRLAAAQIASEGRPLAEARELVDLRAELELDTTSARAIHAVVEASTPGALVAGTVVGGRYRIVRLLGKGGGGRAFLAVDGTLRREVVIKEIAAEAGDADALREARISGAISHPNVVAIHDILTRPGLLLLVQEYVAGGSLQERLDTQGRLAQAPGIALIEQVLEGLAAVHAHGIVHGDVKPANILLSAHGHPKLGDFGVATMSAGRTMRFGHAGIFRGTPGHMAPEQLRGEPPTPGSDVWAVGLLMRRALAEPLPNAIASVVARAVSERVEERYPDAASMLAALRTAQPSQGPAPLQ